MEKPEWRNPRIFYRENSSKKKEGGPNSPLHEREMRKGEFYRRTDRPAESGGPPPPDSIPTLRVNFS